MTTIKGLATAIAAAGVLSACGGGSGSDGMSVQAPATTTTTTPAASDGAVPAAAGASDQSFADFQKALSPTETTSALSVDSFTPPADETSLPIPII